VLQLSRIRLYVLPVTREPEAERDVSHACGHGMEGRRFVADNACK
jgi:hypothetical protein